MTSAAQFQRETITALRLFESMVPALVSTRAALTGEPPAEWTAADVLPTCARCGAVGIPGTLAAVLCLDTAGRLRLPHAKRLNAWRRHLRLFWGTK